MSIFMLFMTTNASHKLIFLIVLLDYILHLLSIGENQEQYTEEGGGRNDNFVAIMTFEDGSVAPLTYTALGSKGYPKEQLEVFVDGKVIKLDGYKKLAITGANATGLETKLSDKGQKEEINALAKAIQKGSEWLSPLWQQTQATEISFEVERKLLRRKMHQEQIPMEGHGTLPLW